MIYNLNKSSRILITGHNGLIGSALVRRFVQEGFTDLLFFDEDLLDLTDMHDVNEFFNRNDPELVIQAMTRFDGILANVNFPADIMYLNLMTQTNLINAASNYGTKAYIYFGSSCSYPVNAKQPIEEKSMLTGLMESTSEHYSLAKVTGAKMCEAFNKQYGTHNFVLIPATTYGPFDSFDEKVSHVIPALISKFYEAKVNGKPEVTVWGTGSALREFIYVDDIADACLSLLNTEGAIDSTQSPIFNIGTDDEISVKDLAHAVSSVVGYQGGIVFDTSKPEGASRKLLSTAKFKSLTGWKATTKLYEGLLKTYKWYMENENVR